jgi:hypothetical protein
VKHPIWGTRGLLRAPVVCAARLPGPALFCYPRDAASVQCGCLVPVGGAAIARLRWVCLVAPFAPHHLPCPWAPPSPPPIFVDTPVHNLVHRALACSTIYDYDTRSRNVYTPTPRMRMRPNHPALSGQPTWGKTELQPRPLHDALTWRPAMPHREATPKTSVGQRGLRAGGEQ